MPRSPSMGSCRGSHAVATHPATPLHLPGKVRYSQEDEETQGSGARARKARDTRERISGTESKRHKGPDLGNGKQETQGTGPRERKARDKQETSKRQAGEYTQRGLPDDTFFSCATISCFPRIMRAMKLISPSARFPGLDGCRVHQLSLVASISPICEEGEKRTITDLCIGLRQKR